MGEHISKEVENNFHNTVVGLLVQRALILYVHWSSNEKFIPYFNLPKENHSLYKNRVFNCLSGPILK